MAEDADQHRKVRRREYNRRYRETHREQLNAYKRERWATHPEERARRAAYQAAYNAEHREKILAQKREAERRRQARIRAEEARKQAKRDNAKAWRAAHPEEAAAKNAAWQRENRERKNEINRAWRQRNLERERAKARDRAQEERAYRAHQTQKRREANKAARNAQLRAQRAENPEHINAQQREYRGRERHRIKAGLPPFRIHRTSLNQKAQHEAEAAAFFGADKFQRANSITVRDLGREADLVAASAAEAARYPLERRAYLRELAEKRRAQLLKLAERRRRAARVRVARFFASRRWRALCEEVRMDNIARIYRGREPYPSEKVEALRRATLELAEPPDPASD